MTENRDGVPGDGAVPRQAPGPAWREIEGTIVLLPPGGEELIRFNRTGSFLWRHLDGSRNVGDLARALAEAFGISLERAREDTGRFLAELRDAGLVSWD